MSNELVSALIGAIIGGILSLVGGYLNSKMTLKESKKVLEEQELQKAIDATKRLLTKFRNSNQMVITVVIASKNMPPETGGVKPTIEHRIEPIDWINDLSIISTRLTEDDFNKITNYFAGLSRCDDIINRVWELRAAKCNYQLQLVSYWTILEATIGKKDEEYILKRLFDVLEYEFEVEMKK